MRLAEKYKKEIVPKMKEKFGYTNIHAVPRIVKVVINVGAGRHAKEKDYLDEAAKTLEMISGQKPVFTKAKKAISSFKIRQGMVIGVAVTLRGKRMYDFLEKLVNISLPRIRDFRGIEEKAIDMNGNLTIGFKEQIVFPDIKPDEVKHYHGLEVCIATAADSREAGVELFRLFGFPLKARGK